MLKLVEMDVVTVRLKEGNGENLQRLDKQLELELTRKLLMNLKVILIWNKVISIEG